MAVFNFGAFDDTCEYEWVLYTRAISGSLQIFVCIILVVVFANEKTLSCHEGLIVQPVFQGLLGFLALASATTGAEVALVVVSGVLNLLMIVVNWLFYYLYRRSGITWNIPLDRKYLIGTMIMTVLAGTSSIVGLGFQTSCHKIGSL